MKKILFVFLFSIVNIVSFCQDEPEQYPVNDDWARVIFRFPPYESLLRMVKSYFRSNPYTTQFSRFVSHLLNDPAIANKKMNKKTDSSFFSFWGEYKNYSLFGFKPDRTEIKLVEMELPSNDSLSIKDTMFVYQLLGYSYGGKTGLETVEKEFSKFNRHYSKSFFTQFSNVEKNHEIIGGINDYFVPGLPGSSPLTAAWGKLDEFQNVFIVTLRLKVKENVAILPMPFDSQQ